MTFVQPPFWSTGWGYPRAPHAVSVVVTPPALEPLTRAQGKLRAGLDWADGDPRDALMDGFISSARATVEKDTGIALLTQTIDMFYDRPPYGWTPLDLPWRPVQAVTSVKSIDTAGATNTLDPLNYILDPSSVSPIPARIGLAVSGAWPSDLRPFQPVVVRLVLGFVSVALLQAAAPELIDAVGILVANAATVGRDRFTEQRTHDEYEDKIAAYRPVMVA